MPNTLAFLFNLLKTTSFLAVSILPRVERAMFERKDNSSCEKLFCFLSSFMRFASFLNNTLSIVKLSATMTKEQTVRRTIQGRYSIVTKDKTVLIDLDGVLNDYTGHFDKNNIPPIKIGASKFLKNLSENML